MARGHVRIRTYVRTYVDTDSGAARADGRTRTGRTERQTDGQQICNALTLVLNEMRYGGRERRSADGWRAEGTMGRRVVPAMVGCGGWSAVGANSHLTNPIINN